MTKMPASHYNPGVRMLAPKFLFILSAILAGVFVALAADVMHHGMLERYDHVLAKRIYTAVGEVHTWRSMVMTGFGSGFVTVPFSVLCGLGLIVLRRWRWLAFWAVTLLGVAQLNAVLKDFVARPRPSEYTFFLTSVVDKGYSFPSGHTMGALVVWGALAYMLAKMYPSRGMRIGGIVAVWLIVLSVSVGLMYVGVHYLTDVLGAYAAGGAWLALCVGVMEYTCKERQDAAQETCA
jgi:undecaprenyl-diphosphatase